MPGSSGGEKGLDAEPEGLVGRRASPRAVSGCVRSPALLAQKRRRSEVQGAWDQVAVLTRRIRPAARRSGPRTGASSSRPGPVTPPKPARPWPRCVRSTGIRCLRLRRKGYDRGRARYARPCTGRPVGWLREVGLVIHVVGLNRVVRAQGCISAIAGVHDERDVAAIGLRVGRIRDAAEVRLLQGDGEKEFRAVLEVLELDEIFARLFQRGIDDLEAAVDVDLLAYVGLHLMPLGLLLTFLQGSLHETAVLIVHPDGLL